MIDATTPGARDAIWRSGPLPARPIGLTPLVESFDLEATVEGRYADEALSRLGLAFE